MEQVLGYSIGQAAGGTHGDYAKRGLALFTVWYQRYTQRCALRQLDDRMLIDIGVSREQALAEARKPFWVA